MSKQTEGLKSFRTCQIFSRVAYVADAGEPHDSLNSRPLLFATTVIVEFCYSKSLAIAQGAQKPKNINFTAEALRRRDLQVPPAPQRRSRRAFVLATY